MELYFKYNTLKNIVELFGLFKGKSIESFELLDYSYLEQYMNSRFSQSVRMEMLDYYKDFVLELSSQKDNDFNSSERINQLLVSLFVELTKTQKVELYIALLDYVIDSEFVTDNKRSIELLQEQLKQVEKIFELNSNKMNEVAHFIKDDLSLADNSQSLMVIGNFRRIKLRSFSMYQKDDIKGKIVTMFVPSINSFLFKYNGSEELQLNKQIVFPERVYQLSLGGVIEGTSMAPIYFSDLYSSFGKDNIERLELVAKGISKTFEGTNLGVKELSFKIKSGQLMAVMGGSGTGKTTLFNLLSGIVKPDRGNVLLNGNDLHEYIDKLKRHLGYVPQEDLLIEELTVYENLKYSAQLCRDDLSNDEIDDLVVTTLYDFGLAKIKDLKVGNPLQKVISGGQRKRLNIALEIIRRPDVLFVDEPTSGLSSSDALLVIKLLKRIASLGNIVIINIHQPQSDLFVLFDKLLILDENGYAAFYGNPLSASSYFKKHLQFVDSINDDSLKYGQCNPEQVINLLEYKERSDDGELTNDRVFNNTDWHKFYIKEEGIEQESENIKLSKPLTTIPNNLRQFWIYFKRNVAIRKSDSQYLSLIFLGAPLLALMMAFFLKSTDLVTHEYRFIDNDNIPAYLFISVVVALFLGLILSSGEIYRDLKVIKRESFLNLSAVSYLNSKVVYICIVNAIQILFYVFVGNTILEIKGMYFKYSIILWMTAVSSSMLGLYISSKLKSILSIYITIPFLLIPQILLAGAILDFDKIHHTLASRKYVPIYANVNISRWAYESLMVLQFTENKYDRGLINHLVRQSKMSYYANFYVPKIETQLSLLNTENDEQIKAGIKNLIKNLAKEFPQVKKEVEMYEITRSNIPKIELVMKKVKKWLRTNINQVYKEIEVERKKKVDQPAKTNYYNQKLSEFVLKSNDYVKYVYSDGEMIRKFQPGYYISDNNYGRAHYYAPYKKIGELKIRTWIFNLFVILLFAFLIYIVVLLHLKKNKF